MHRVVATQTMTYNTTAIAVGAECRYLLHRDHSTGYLSASGQQLPGHEQRTITCIAVQAAFHILLCTHVGIWNAACASGTC